ncbi:hypothetical protein Golob_013234 [Gossypium lobatum]|uniref:Aminotransferase-like plant mobile domain-containing protein n=1 Tax=Gossypium lobatum TaxID=34289 RepID=A0A7J8LNV5_9ROSI|nr:hypothetical protein [Gossypium lobatum]
MVGSLIHFDDKHISVDQLQMCYIRNLPTHLSPLIELYLREAGFSHVALVGRGCKLDLTLLRLPVDGLVVTRSVHAADWRYACDKLWALVWETIYGECIIEEFFVNPNIWHVNVLLVVYATIEMHKPDRAIVVPKLTPEYMPWFRIHGKRYLYGEEARGLQLHTRRPQLVSIHPKTDEASPSSGASSPMYYTPMPSTFPTTMTYRLSMFQASNESLHIMPSVYGTQHSYFHFLFVTQTPLRSLFYQSGSSSQPPILSPEDAR